MDPEKTRKQWLLQNEKVCICRSSPRKRFIAAIEAGAKTVEQVNRAVGSRRGDCRGERCGPKIEEMLERSGRSSEK